MNPGATGEFSKSISKNDEAAKDFVQESLGGDATRGFDVDSVYCVVKLSERHVRWCLFEFLKCVTVPPERSHPKYYWSDTSTTTNRRKFLSLWALCLGLRDKSRNQNANLVLVNYSDSKSKVKVMVVQSASDAEIVTKDEILTFDEWRARFRKFNKEKPGATWEAINIIKPPEADGVGNMIVPWDTI